MKLPGCDLLVIADLRGRFLRIDRGRRRFGPGLAVGGTLASLVTEESVADLLDLLFAARRGGAALALDLRLTAEDARLHGQGLALAALARGPELILLGGSDEAAFLALCRELPSQSRALGGGVAKEALTLLAELAGEAGSKGGRSVFELEEKLEEQQREIARLREELARFHGDRSGSS